METILPGGSTDRLKFQKHQGLYFTVFPGQGQIPTGQSQTASLSGRLASLTAGPWRRKRKATILVHNPSKAQVSLTAPTRMGKVESLCAHPAAWCWS